MLCWGLCWGTCKGSVKVPINDVYGFYYAAEAILFSVREVSSVPFDTIPAFNDRKSVSNKTIADVWNRTWERVLGYVRKGDGMTRPDLVMGEGNDDG